MCATCGCGAEATHSHPPGPRNGHDHGHDHGRDHGHDHGHAHGHESGHAHAHTHAHAPPPPEATSPGARSGRAVSLEVELLQRNDRRAAANREWLAARGVLALNLVSSPGSGKTTLLERTLQALSGRVPATVIEGDQETELDAARVRATGVPVLQVNTGTGCHLDAEMIARALGTLAPSRGSVLFVENVGNLVCPALFDLGERAKVLVMSVTEGAEKPLKYPHMFRAADLLLINKIDLLPYVSFDLDACLAAAERVNPRLSALPVSATRGDGFGAWLAWLSSRLPAIGEATRGA